LTRTGTNSIAITIVFNGNKAKNNPSEFNITSKVEPMTEIKETNN